MLQAGVVQNIDARRFGVYRNTIGSRWRRFQQYVNTRDRNSSCRPRVASRRQDSILDWCTSEIALKLRVIPPVTSLREYGM